MEALVVKSENKKDLDKLRKLIKEFGLESTTLSSTEIEDLGLSMLMKEVDRSETVSREEIMRKLNRK